MSVNAVYAIDGKARRRKKQNYLDQHAEKIDTQFIAGMEESSLRRSPASLLKFESPLFSIFETRYNFHSRFNKQ